MGLIKVISPMIGRYLLILAAAISTQSTTDTPEEGASKGIISFNHEPFLTNHVALNGDWEFYPNELISSSEIANRANKSFIKVPSWWSDEPDKPSIQFATYRLQVVLPQTVDSSPMGLTMPDVYCSYDLWVNGVKLGQNGKVGKTKAESKPQWKPETYVFISKTDTLEIILHLSNFYHHRTGISQPILLGQAPQLIERQKEIETANTTLLLGLAMLSLTAGIYYLRLKNISLLLYVLLCISWMFRSAFSNHYQIVQWFPDINWYFSARTEYISIYLSTLFGSLVVGSLFPRDVNKFFRMFFIITSVCFTLFTLFAPPVIFTTYVQLYLGLSAILLLSVLVIIIKAYSESRQGAGLLLITAMFGVAIFGYVILAYEGAFELNELVFNIGFLAQFILTLFMIIWRINKMKTGDDYDIMTFDEATRMKY